MKFMKLGSKPDTFQANGASSRYVLSELTTDVTVIVDDIKFYLHKFPLLSKSAHLQKLILASANHDDKNPEEIHLHDFPGGSKSFEICAKFCYGITVTLNPYNVVSARCAAEYLEMTEDVDRGNLIFKIDAFLNSSIFKTCWKDSIIILQTTKSHFPWSEQLKIVVDRCVDSIATKIVMEPEKVTWSYTNKRKIAVTLPDKIVELQQNDTSGVQSSHVPPKDWWVEDVSELEIDLYKRVMLAAVATANLMNNKRRRVIDASVVGEALRTYAVRWLPDSVEALVSDDLIERNRALLEVIISLLPSSTAAEKCGCSCGFLLKLLKASILVDVDESLKEDLIEKISSRLDEASVRDLLLPVRKAVATQQQQHQTSMTCCDVELVEGIVKRFVNNKCCSSRWDDGDGSSGENGQLLSVGKLVDAYLAEVGSDPHLDVMRFVELAKLMPDIARPCHDGLYGAINVYLKEHPELSKSEKKKVCSLLDVKRLTAEASMHAAQNERLPIRVVVQVLYFEQVRTSSSSTCGTGTTQTNNTTSSLDDLSNATTPSGAEEDEWENKPGAAVSCMQKSKSLRKQMEDTMKLKADEEKDDDEVEVGLEKNTRRIMRKMKGKHTTKSSRSGLQLLPSRSRRIFDKLWIIGKSGSKSSETSGSSQSPTTSFFPADAKSSVSSSKHRRHSIS